MEITLKHRLIGVTVILALIVIFVPMLFNKHAKKQIIAMQDIPQAPAQTLMEQPKEQQPVATEAVTSQAPDQATTAAEQVNTTQADIEKAQKQVVTEPAKADDQPAIDNTAIEPPTTIETTTDKPEVTIIPAKDMQPAVQKPLMQSTIIHKQKIAHRFARPIHHAKSLHRYSRHSRHLMKARTHHQAYVVQLGSFTDPKHAKILISQLRKKGFTAFGYKSKVNHQLFTRVYIGPSVQLQKATVMRNKLARVTRIQGIVKLFNATHLE